MKHEDYIQEAIELAIENVRSGNGGPFGAVIVKDGSIIARGNNRVTSENDPTAHAEVTAIREACRKLGSFQLDGCILYSSCEPCPMCLGAIYWARPDALYFAADKEDAASAGFDDSFIYKELDLPYTKRHIKTVHIDTGNKLTPFREWEKNTGKIEY